MVKSYHATVFFLIISHLPPGHPIISSEFKMVAVSVKRSITARLRKIVWTELSFEIKVVCVRTSVFSSQETVDVFLLVFSGIK